MAVDDRLHRLEDLVRSQDLRGILVICALQLVSMAMVVEIFPSWERAHWCTSTRQGVLNFPGEPILMLHGSLTRVLASALWAGKPTLAMVSLTIAREVVLFTARCQLEWGLSGRRP